jgi:hypothetical protein
LEKIMKNTPLKQAILTAREMPPRVDLSRVQLHHMAKPVTPPAWAVATKAIARGLVMVAVLAAVFVAGLAAVVWAASMPSFMPQPMPAKAAKVVV